MCVCVCVCVCVYVCVCTNKTFILQKIVVYLQQADRLIISNLIYFFSFMDIFVDETVEFRSLAVNNNYCYYKQLEFTLPVAFDMF